MPPPRGNKHEYYHNIQTSSPLKLAHQSQILCKASIELGNQCVYKQSRTHDHDGRHAHIP